MTAMRRRAQLIHFKDQINGIILPESPKSPLSPVGRVAKRNAKLLNGLGAVATRDSYSEAVVGTLPDLAPFDYEEECPTFSRLIDEDNEEDNLQIEELVIEDGMSDFGSSPDEDAHHRVSILDIPQRYWSWTREYLLKIDEPFVKNWFENLVKRFNEETCKKLYINEPFKCRKRSFKMEETDSFEGKFPKSRLNGSYIAVSTPLPTKLRLKRRTSDHELNGNTAINKQLKLEISPIHERSTKRGDSKLTPLVEDMVDAFFMESMKNSTQFSFASLSRQNSLLENGSNGFHNDKNLNGFHAKNESQCSLDRLIFDDLGEALTKHLVDKGVLPEPSEYLVKSLANEALNEKKVKISREGMKAHDDENNL
uniref:Uncharacterized protein n=1 Tax=Acrobeloides nanus TaxID=290746 RepID=A0A914CX46_9BILA